MVRLETIVGTEAEVRTALATAERRGTLRGAGFAVARLSDGRVAVKVHMVTPGPAVTRKWSPHRTILVAGVVASIAVMLSVVWLIVQTVFAVGHAIADNAGPIVGVLIVIGLVALLAGGRGGGGTFTGTFKGTWR